MILFEISADMCLGFGFLGGKEVQKAGIANAGIFDRESCNQFFNMAINNPVDSSERFALQWVQKYIAKFGGDPGKVTM